MRYVFLLGRILFSAVFLIKSLEHFSSQMVCHATHIGNVPFASFLVPAAGVVAFLGGLSILLGYRVKIGALLLVIFLLPTSFMMHKFWMSGDFYANMMHQYCFLKNMALLGAALMISYYGPGPLSLDGRKKTKTKKK